MKKRILQTAWAKKVTLNGTRIFFDHNFTIKVKQQRSMYKPMREQLRKRNIKSYIITPVKLKIFNEDGSSKTYDNPETAAKALKELDITCDGSSHQTSPQKDDGWNIVGPQYGQNRWSRRHAGAGDTEPPPVTEERLNRYM